jgi:NADPH-dependent ferric siderophore reductase
MTSTKGMLLSAMGRFVLRDARVTSIRELGDRTREVSLEGPGLRDVDWIPGDKIQVLLPTRDVRTYTPASWDARRGTTELVLFAHGESPGASWIRTLAVGDACRFVGPQRSLRRESSQPAVLFGDETSFGLAAALGRSQNAAKLACVFEVGSRPSAQPVIDAIGLPQHGPVVLVERAPSDTHLSEVASEMSRMARTLSGAEIVLSGRAQSIQALRPRLRAGGVHGRSSNKPYWAVGKVGLD